MEDGLNCGGLVQRVSEENISVLPKDHPCDIFGKECGCFFCPCPKYLFEAKLKSFTLMALAEEISTQPSINSVIWLLVGTLTQIYNEKEYFEKGKIQNGQFEETGSTRMCSGAKCGAQGDKSLN